MEVATIDSQVSAAGGFLVVVTATLIGQDESRKSFSQTFFLAPQEKGYFVLNDIFRFVGVVESSTVVTDKDEETASVAALGMSFMFDTISIGHFIVLHSLHLL